MPTVNLYTFSKRVNSTARPSGDGTVVACDLNENGSASLHSPVLKITHSGRPAYNYARFDGRYYYIQDAENDINNVWYLYLKQDDLATHKTAIGNTHGFCVYGSNGNYNKADDRIMLTPEIEHVSASANVSLNTGSFSPCFYVTIAGSGGTRIYTMTPTALANFITEINNKNDDDKEQIAKIYGDIYGMITSIVASPIMVFGSRSEQITLACYQTSLSYHYIDPSEAEAQVLLAEGVAPELSINEDYNFLAYPPYSAYKLFLPWVGEVDLSGEYVMQLSNRMAASAICNLSFDVPSNSVTWTVTSPTKSGGNFGWSAAAQSMCFSAQVGRTIAFSHNQDRTAANIFQGVKTALGVGATAAMFALNPAAGAIAGIGLAAGATQSFMNINTYDWGGRLQTITSGGEMGNGVLINGKCSNKVVLTRFYHNIDGDNLNATYIGAPVGKVGKVSDFGGFVKMNGASVSCADSASVIAAINSAIASGIYYE